MKTLKFKSFTYGLLAVVMLGLFTVSCEKDDINSVIAEENAITQNKLPLEVDKQLNDLKSNLKKHTGEAYKLVDYKVIDKNSENYSKASLLESSGEEGIAYGNIADPNTVIFSKMNTLSSQSRQMVSKDIDAYKSKLIKPSDAIMELTWNANGKTFKSLCRYNDKGIVWDNVIFGLIEAAPEAKETKGVSKSETNRVLNKWSKSWWTVNWIFGSKRGEMGYKITIFHQNGRVIDVDREDWADINIGKEKSESKIIKRTGTHGKIQYALGLATPTATLSFNRNGFTVSSGGIGSASVRNGTKVLFP